MNKQYLQHWNLDFKVSMYGKYCCISSNGGKGLHKTVNYGNRIDESTYISQDNREYMID